MIYRFVMSWSADSIRAAIVNTIPLVEEKQSTPCHVRRSKRFRSDVNESVEAMIPDDDQDASDAESHASLDNQYASDVEVEEQAMIASVCWSSLVKGLEQWIHEPCHPALKDRARISLSWKHWIKTMQTSHAAHPMSHLEMPEELAKYMN